MAVDVRLELTDIESDSEGLQHTPTNASDMTVEVQDYIWRIERLSWN